MFRVEIDKQPVALMASGDKALVRLPEGQRNVSIAPTKTSGRKRKKGAFEVELQPFVYTKIIFANSTAKKNKLSVSVLADDVEVKTHTIEY